VILRLSPDGAAACAFPMGSTIVLHLEQRLDLTRASGAFGVGRHPGKFNRLSTRRGHEIKVADCGDRLLLGPIESRRASVRRPFSTATNANWPSGIDSEPRAILHLERYELRL
jgi:hypothetical protein